MTTAAPRPEPVPELTPAGPRARRVPIWHTVAFALVVALYLAAVVSGTTTSSLGMPHLTAERQDLGTHLGSFQRVRSDEYNVFTPVQLSMLSTGGAPTMSPFDSDSSLVLRYPHGPFQSVVFWDTWLLRLGPVLPDAQLFAAHWWLPSLLVLLCMPTWMVLMGGRRQLGWLAGILVVLAPSNFWWSLQPTMLLAYTLAGCTAMLAAARRFRGGQRLIPILQCAVGGLCIAGMPSNYLPWAVVLGGGILLASSVRLLSAGGRSGFLAVGLTGVLAAGLGAGVLLEGLDGLRSVTSTVYPGMRRTGAAAVAPAVLYGAPALGHLNAAEPIASNASELSSSFTITLLVLPFAWIASRSRLLRRERAGEIALAAWGALWLLWCSVDLGGLGAGIPVVSSVLPVRAAQAVGVIGIIALALALSHARSGRPAPAFAAGTLAAGITVIAGHLLRARYLPDMPDWEPWVAGALTGSAVLLLLAAPRRWYGTALASIGALAVIAHASPLQAGLGDLRGSATARTLAEAGTVARANGTYWASDVPQLDIVLLANGVPSLTGFQRSGPDAEMWERVDPELRFRAAWNRGGGYAQWHWREGGPTTIETGWEDLISTTIDPCTLAAAVPELTTIAAGEELTASPCLRHEQDLRWNARTVHVYTVRR